MNPKDAITLAREAFIKPFEGYARRLPDGSCQAYPDPGTGAEPWTIGYGSTGPEIQPGTIWTREQAEQAVEFELLNKLMALLKLSPNLATESDRRVAALVSFAYNCGIGNYRISTLRKRVQAKDWDGAASEIIKWNKAAGRVMRGLTIRRSAEAAFLR